MGWNSANPIFDEMALKTKELGLDEQARLAILETLIGSLQDQDWDTEDESLEDFKDDPTVVEAFRRKGIPLHEADDDWDDSLDDEADDRNGAGEEG